MVTNWATRWRGRENEKKKQQMVGRTNRHANERRVCDVRARERERERERGGGGEEAAIEKQQRETERGRGRGAAATASRAAM